MLTHARLCRRRTPVRRSLPSPSSAASRGPHEVLIDILYCGVCHSDIHQARDEWGGSIFPMVPGHEIVGRVAQVGAQVDEVQGRRRRSASAASSTPAAHCAHCTRGEEQYCDKGMTRHLQQHASATPAARRPTAATPRASPSTRTTCCGSRESIPLDRAAPLLCAGITTYSPLRHFGVKAGRQRRRGRPGRPGPHGGEAGRGDGRGGDRAQHVARPSAPTRCALGATGLRRHARRRRRSRQLAQPVRLHHRHRVRRRTTTTPTSSLLRSTAPWSCSASPTQPAPLAAIRADLRRRDAWPVR